MNHNQSIARHPERSKRVRQHTFAKSKDLRRFMQKILRLRNSRFARIAPLRMTGIITLMLGGFLLSAHAQTSDFRLHFRQGDLHRVVTTEILRLSFHFPQVEDHDARPSVRTSVYSFTERVDSVLADGSALMGASLDSFRTGIDFGEGKHAENFFRFNSAGEWDITHELHDIKVLPRAQFLGHVIRYIMKPDGTITQFLNLQDFQQAAIGHGYDYDLVHAMLSLSDSLRMGQLLEMGFGGLAAARSTYTSPSTTAEIPVTRTVSARHSGGESFDVSVRYTHPPDRIEYLEGIAMPLGILGYHGSGTGSITVSKGFLKHSEFQDSARVVLHVDIDTVPEDITRSVTTDVSPIAVLRGRNISIKEIAIHKGTLNDSLQTEPNGSSPTVPNGENGNINVPIKPEAPPVKNNSTEEPR